MTARSYPTREEGEIIDAGHVNALQEAVTALSVITGIGDVIVGDSSGVETALPVSSTQGSVLGVDTNQAANIGYIVPRTAIHERVMQVLANAGAATLTTAGFTAAPTATGTPTSVDDDDGELVNYQSGAVSGNVGGLNSAAAVSRRAWGGNFAARVKLPSTITLNRFHIGLYASSPMASATPAIDMAGFRYDTGSDGTAFWRTVTNDGGVTPTTTTTTVAATADTTYLFRIAFESGQVYFYINSARVAVHATDLPGNSTMLSYYVAVATLTGAARNIKINMITLTQK